MANLSPPYFALTWQVDGGMFLFILLTQQENCGHIIFDEIFQNTSIHHIVMREICEKNVERVWIIKSRIEKYVHNIIRLKFSDCKYFSCWSGKTLDVDTFFVYFVFVGHKIIRLFLRVLSQRQDGIVLWYINSKLFLYGCKQKICFYLLAQKVVSNKLTSIWWIP